MQLPVIAQKQPYELDLKTGLYSWCTCGKSQKQPFCDASHRDTEYRSLKFEIKEEQKVWLCGCKNTKTPPFCDGTHNTL